MVVCQSRTNRGQASPGTHVGVEVARSVARPKRGAQNVEREAPCSRVVCPTNWSTPGGS